MKLMATRLRLNSSFRAARLRADPESRDSGFASSMRPGMTAYNSYPSLIRLRQAQHLLGNETENELRADRGDARDQGFAQIAFDMKFLGIAEAAVGHHRLLASLEAGFGGEVFRGVGRRAA